MPRHGSRAGDVVDQRRDVGQAEIEALAGERMDDVRGVAEQHPAGAAQPLGAAEQERPGGPLRGQRQRAGVAPVASSERLLERRGIGRQQRPARASGSDQTRL